MKGLVFNGLLIMLALSCQDQTEEDFNATNEWIITWQMGNHTASGHIYMLANNEARVVVKEPDDFFFKTPQEVLLDFSVGPNSLKLTRKDNGFSMDYKIIEKQTNYYKLSYADDLEVKIFR